MDYPYVWVCILHKAKNMNGKTTNLMSAVNETRALVQHELFKYKCGFNKSICNSKKKWSHDECWCEFKELDGWGFGKDDYMWNPGTCECGCNKACKLNKYLAIKNCSCGERLFGKLALGCDDEVLNTTETFFNEKKVTLEK